MQKETQANTKSTISKQQQKEKFQAFKKWFHENGGLQTDIKFPTYFEPTNYTGISAFKDIKPNKVILAVPKKLIVSVSAARNSPLSKIIQSYQIFKGEENQDKDYNILTLFLIYQKMKIEKSFYFPYIKLLTSSQTIVDWTVPQILSIKDPYIHLKFVQLIKEQFNPIFQKFKQICQNNKDLFPLQLKKQMFQETYAAVMTRGFGWGLPETMMVPFADFFNHSANGVNHYAFNQSLQDEDEQQYVKKRYELDLSVFEIDNSKTLPINYGMNDRQKFLSKYMQRLQSFGIKLDQSVRMDPKYTNPMVKLLQNQIIQNDFQQNLYLSSDSQDNDSQSDQQDNPADFQQGYIKTKQYLKKVFKMTQKHLQQRFSQPKPLVNREFEDGITFQWWYKRQTNESYFIVATSKKIHKGDQIFNCYGRRNNRFLLIWYGFCYPDNKYDSLPFRIWSTQVSNQTGQLTFTKYVSQKQFIEHIPIGNNRYHFSELSMEFRLKATSLNYKLITYIRYMYVRKYPDFRVFYRSNNKNLDVILDLQIEIEVFLMYEKYLNQLFKRCVYEKQNQKQLKEIWKNHQDRLYYKEILQKSNQKIIYNQMIGVKEVLKILPKVDKQNLKTLYLNSFSSYTNCSYENICEFKTVIREYFKFLSQYKDLLKYQELKPKEQKP